MYHLEKVSQHDLSAFREMVLAYWLELMPASDVMNNPERQASYFQTQFIWDDANRQPHWTLLDDRHIGFVNFSIFAAEKRAEIEDFYVIPEARRRGSGTEIVNALYRHFDSRGIERIDLTVRRDNPNALAFWEAQGFMIAKYVLRQYRDPTTGTAFRGALSSDFTTSE